jgi:hypothetical protein
MGWGVGFSGTVPVTSLEPRKMKLYNQYDHTNYVWCNDLVKCTGTVGQSAETLKTPIGIHGITLTNDNNTLSYTNADAIVGAKSYPWIFNNTLKQFVFDNPLRVSEESDDIIIINCDTYSSGNNVRNMRRSQFT